MNKNMGSFVHLAHVHDGKLIMMRLIQMPDGKLDHLVHMYGGMLPSPSLYARLETASISPNA